MKRFIRRSRASSSVREDTRSHPINSINLFIHRKYNKRRVKKRVKMRKSFFI